MGTTIDRLTFPVTGMSCVGCASSVENILRKTDGVQQANVNFAANTVLVDFDTSIVTKEELKSRVSDAGYDLIIVEKDAVKEQEEIQNKEYKDLKKQFLGAAILTIPIFIIGMFFMEWTVGKYISFALATPVLFYPIILNIMRKMGST